MTLTTFTILFCEIPKDRHAEQLQTSSGHFRDHDGELQYISYKRSVLTAPQGPIAVELYWNQAKKTCQNFAELVSCSQRVETKLC